MLNNYSFNVLGSQAAMFDVRRENTKVVNFHLAYGAKMYKETDLDLYFKFEAKAFPGMLLRYKNFHNISYD